MAFDYDSPAELFMPKLKGIRRRATPHYRRFATAAEAIRFAVEEMPAVRTLGAWMQVGDERFNSDEIAGCITRISPTNCLLDSRSHVNLARLSRLHVNASSEAYRIRMTLASLLLLKLCHSHGHRQLL